MSTSFTFNEVTIAPVFHNNQPWVRSVELARALGYSDERKVSHLYGRHADEFSSDMSLVLNLGTSGNPTDATRIFSLRGCHLLAMFARTPVAKAFRVWVLDVLETLNNTQPVTNCPQLPDAPITPDQQCTLQAIVRAKVEAIPEAERSKGLYPQIWGRFKNHFRVSKYDQLPQSRMSEAVAYLTQMDVQQKALPMPEPRLSEKGLGAMERLLRLRSEIFRASVEVRHILSSPFVDSGARRIPESQKEFSHALNEAASNFFMAVNNNLASAENMFKAYVEAEKMMRG